MIHGLWPGIIDLGCNDPLMGIRKAGPDIACERARFWVNDVLLGIIIESRSLESFW